MLLKSTTFNSDMFQLNKSTPVLLYVRPHAELIWMRIVIRTNKSLFMFYYNHYYFEYPT